MSEDKSLVSFLHRLGYAVAVILTIPLFPLWFLGICLTMEDGDGGWFTCIGAGLLFFGFVFGYPLYLLARAVKWIFTGRCFA